MVPSSRNANARRQPIRIHAVSQPRLAKYRTALRWLVAAVLLVLAVRLVLADPEPLRRALVAPKLPLAGIAALVALNQLLMSVRFSLAVSRCGGGGVPPRTWFRLTSVGQFLNLFVPQLGNVYRAVTLKREYGISYLSYASGLTAFVLLDLQMGFLIALGTIALVERDLELATIPAIPVLMGVLLLVVAAPYLVLAALDRRRGDGDGKLRGRLITLIATMREALHDKGFLLRFFAINLLTTAVHVAALRLAFHATGASASLGSLMVLQVFVKMSFVVAITPGNLGINEIVYGVLAHASTSTAEQGVTVALLMRIIGTLTVIVIGVLAGGRALLFQRRDLLDAAGRLGEPPSGETRGDA